MKTRPKTSEESKAFLESIVENIPDMIFIKDAADLRFVLFNKAGEELLGFTRAEMIGKNDYDFFPRSEADFFTGKDREVLSGGGLLDIPEEPIRTKRKGERWLHTKKIPIPDATGKPAFLLGISEDITERRAAEARFKALLEAAPDALALVDQEGLIVQVNAQTERMFGYAREELLGRPVELLIPERFRGRHAGHRADFSSDPKARPMGADLALFGRRKDGTEFPADVSLSPMRTEKETLTIADIRDVTERKRAEEALRKAQEQYRTVVEDQTELISRFRPDNTMIFVNEAYCRFFGKRPDEVIGKKWQPAAHPEDVPMILEKLAALSPASPMVMIENRVFSGSGQVRWMQFINRAFFDQDGTLVETQSVGRDVTDLKDLERSLRQKDEHLRMVQKLDAIGRLAGGISHEFNNILAGIVCFADMIRKSSDESDSRRSDAREIMALGDRAATLVKQLVTFSQPKPTLKAAISLNDLVGRGARMIAAVCGERIQVTTSPAPNLPLAQANPDQLDQVLINLCLNARDAIRGAGRIAIETGRVELKEPHLTRRGFLPAGVYVCLSVTDSGQGIAEENQPRIFEPFFTTKPPGRGTGLGLAVASGIMREHGGGIDFDSRPGGGATFRIYLPAAVSATASRSPDAPPQAQGPAGKGELILVADDEAVMRHILVRILKSGGYATLAAKDGLEAVELFKANQDRVALVLLDVIMPNLDGAKACDRIRALRPGVKVLFMSGYAPAETREVLLERKEELISKPFASEEILAQIARKLAPAT